MLELIVVGIITIISVMVIAILLAAPIAVTRVAIEDRDWVGWFFAVLLWLLIYALPIALFLRWWLG